MTWRRALEASFLLTILSGLSPLAARADLQPNDFTGAGITALFPNSDGYSAASASYNLRLSFAPSAIAYPKSPNDVSEIVKLGAANNLNVVARSGGHSYIDNGLGGKNGTLVIDLSNMKGISIDPSSHVATIETGNRLGNVAVELNNAGRALPHGTCPYVGIGGHSAFGGFGFTSRLWGLTLDTVKAVNTVLANGTIARVTADNYPDLFFALRGSAPSFGITTSIEVETFAAPEYSIVFSYTWDIPADTASQALIDFQSFASSGIPPEFGAGFTISKSDTQGNLNFNLLGGWYGEQSKLDSVIKPYLDKLPQPKSNDRLGNGTYIDSVSQLGGGLDLSQPDHTDTFYAKSLMTSEGSPVSKEAVSAYMKYLANDGANTSTNWFMQVDLYGGSNSKVNQVPVDSTAFVRRDTQFTWQFYASSASYTPPFPDEGFTFVDGAVNSVVGAMPSGWDYSAYANYIEDRLDNWQHLYYGNHYDRLTSIKKAVDPNGVFTFPTSVQASS
ncbi:glucooligosaccharide oxidase [Marasmius fiardii PR-910]|nr:glucooligosaccharide oxidase [Marasmius fiardii PR-910]